MLLMKIFCLTLMISQQRKYFKLRRRRTMEFAGWKFGLAVSDRRFKLKTTFYRGFKLMVNKFIYISVCTVYPNLPEDGCQQSFLSLLRERALCALYLYRSLDIKDTSLHNWVESVTNPEQDIVIKMNTEAIQKLKTSGMKYMLIQVLRGNRAFNRL